MNHCPNCGAFLKQETHTEFNTPGDGKIKYLICNNCDYEKPIGSD